MSTDRALCKGEVNQPLPVDLPCPTALPLPAAGVVGMLAADWLARDMWA